MMTNDYKKDKPYIKQLKWRGLLTEKRPLKNHERIANWYAKGGQEKRLELDYGCN